MNGIWLNPKYFNNGQSAAKGRLGQGSTTISKESRAQAIGARSGIALCGIDIVWSLMKVKVWRSVAADIIGVVKKGDYKDKNSLY